MVQLLEQQKECVAHLNKWKVGALFMEAGTGKTRAAMSLVNSTSCTDVFWIAPLRTINNAKTEVDKWGGWNMQAHYYGVESISASERIWLELLNAVKSSKQPFVVVDESLKIKNVGAKRTKRLLEIGRITEWKLVLNGTPISRNLLDMWAQMEFLSPKILNMTLNQYKNTFCCYTTITKQKGRSYYKKEFITGYENVDYLYSLIRHYVYKCDLSLQISQNYHTVKYVITDDEESEYKAIKEKFLSMEELVIRDNNIFLAMTQKMQHAYCCSPAKFDCLDKLFSTTIKEEDTIIFCKYVASKKECQKRYPKACVLSYQTSAYGLNLQQYHNTIYFDKVWDYALREQSSRRTFRTGQEIDCEYWDITGNVGLERMIDKNIEKKISMTEYLKAITKEDLKKQL